MSGRPAQQPGPGRPEHLPLLSSQYWMWLRVMQHGDNAASAMECRVDLEGPIDPDRLVWAWQQALSAVESHNVDVLTVDGVPRLLVGAREHRVVVVPEGEDIDLTGIATEVAVDGAWDHAVLVHGARRSRLHVAGHHFANDGAGSLILLRLFAEIYRSGGTSAAAHQRGGLRELVREEEEYLGGPRASADAAYWEATMAGFVPHPPTSSRTWAPPMSNLGVTWRIEPALTEAITERARAAGVAWYTVAFAATAALTARERGTSDVVVMVPVACRPSRLSKSVAALRANFLPLRLRLRPGESADDLLRRTTRELKQLLAHQQYPAGLVRAMVPIDTAGAPLGPTVNVLPATEPLDLGSAKGEVTITAFGPVDDIQFSFLGRVDGSILVACHGNPQIHDESSLHAALGSLRGAISSFAAGGEFLPGGPPSFGHLVGPADPTAARPVFARLVELARTDPGRVALVDVGGEPVTYAALAEAVAQRAALLRAAGVDAGLPVVHMGHRSVDTVVNLLALWQRGATYVPVGPDWPIARIREVVQDCGAGLVLVSDMDDLDPSPVVEGVRCLRTGREPRAATQLTGEGGSLDADARSEVPYVIYTSGSTGRPKGAAVAWEGMVNHLRAKTDLLGDAAGGTTAVTAPLTFDISVWQLVLPLYEGGQALLVAERDVHDVHALTRTLDEARVHVAELVPGLLAAVLELWRSHGGVPAALRVMLVTGEALPPALCAAWTETVPDVRLVNAYGPTECSDDVTHWEVPPSFAAGGRVLIGSPVRNCQLHVLDDLLRPVEVGGVGELFVGDVVVGVGYLGRPGETAAAFVADPFSGEPGARMYRTGDVVRLWPGSELEFLSRVDHQVKVNGYRIETGEVEAAIACVAGVRRSAVVATRGPHVRLAGFVVGATPIPEVAAAVAETIPPYMVPTVWRRVEALPTTPNGKVDHAVLQAWVGDAGSRAEQPADELTVLIGRQMAQVLGIDRVGAHDSFIDLGGNSLAAIRLVGLLRSDLDLPVTLEDVFRYPSPIELARHRTDALAPRPEAGSLAHEPAVATPGQRRMWLLQEFQPDDWSYNVALRLEAEARDADLLAAVRDLVAAHDGLRTRLRHDGGLLVQHVVPPEEVRWERVHRVHELAEPPDDDVLAQYVREPISLTADIPVRLHECRYQGRVTLLLVAHHAACDGWSLRLLAQELDETLGGTPVPTGSPRGALVDYGRWMASATLRDSDWYRAQLDFWSRELVDAPARFHWPGAAESSSAPPRDAATLRLVIEPDAFARIDKAGRAAGVTPFTVFQVAVATAIGEIVGREEILLGTAVHGRRDAEFDRTIGFFANTVLLRTRCAPGTSVAARLTAARRALVESLANGHVPFDEVITHVRRRSGSFSPDVLQVMVSYQRESRLSHVGARPVATGAAKFDLAIECEERGARPSLHVLVEHATDVIGPDLARRIIQRITDHLEELTTMAHDDVALAPGAQPAVANVLATPLQGTFLELIDQGYRSNPDGVAAVHAGSALTHAELHERSSRWARALRRLGVAEGSMVPVAASRSLEWLTAFVAVLRTGAAVVPVDPEQPDRRLAELFAAVRATYAIADPSLALRDTGAETSILTPEHLDAADPGPTPPPPPPDSVAYVIFTSGSTGRPKAVTVSHANAHSFVRGILGHHRDGSRPRVVQFGSTGFDAIIWEIGLSLSRGGTLLIPTPLERAPGPPLADYLEQQGATHVLLPPSVLGAMPSTLSVATDFSVGGEALRPSLIRRWADRILMRNVYGPTETTVVCLAGEPLRVTDPPALRGEVGNMRTHVLTETLGPVAPGHVGELYLTGDMVSLGYLSDPALTACRFVASPYGPPGSRMYATGDHVRLEANGDLIHVGRRDDQVKVRGNRVELSEVVTALEELPYVESAVVLPLEEGETLRLIAFVAYRDRLPIDGEAVLEKLREVLPVAAVPHRILAVPEMPQTINHKVDVRALRTVYEDSRRADVQPAAQPAEPGQPHTEGLIREAYRDLLGVAVTGHTDFVAAGGDSISAVSLVAALRAQGVYVSPHDVLSLRTPARLASSAGASGDDDPAAHRGRTLLLPVAQWYASRVGATVGFTHSVALRLPGGTTTADVEAALLHLAHRHPLLTARLAEEAPVVLHVPGAPPDVPLEQGAPPDDGLALPAAWIEQPLDPVRDGLWRNHVVTAQGVPDVLWIQIHHYAVDAVSWRVILTDLDRLLAPGATAADEPARPSGVSFRRWSSLLWQSLDGVPREPVVAQWSEVLSRQGANPWTPSGRRARARTSWWDGPSARIVAGLQGPAAEQLLLAALASAIAHHRETRGRGADHVVVRLEGHGRDALPGDLDVSQTVGWFTVEHPVAIVVRDDDGAIAAPRTLVDRTRDAVAALPGRRSTYGLLRYGPDAPVHLTRVEPDVALNYLGRLDQARPRNVSIVRDVRPDGGFHRPVLHELALTAAVVPTPGGPRLRLDWEWADDQLSEADTSAIEEVLARFVLDAGGAAADSSPGTTPRSWREGLDEVMRDLGID